MAIIELKDVRKFYDMGAEQVRALDGVDLTIERGEYVAIMGPSGSGKSTLMNLLGCLDTPSAGSYVLNGTAVEKLSDHELAAIRKKRGWSIDTRTLAPGETVTARFRLEAAQGLNPAANAMDAAMLISDVATALQAVVSGSQ